MQKGKVFLVGAGPGDIGLITIKGLDAIKQAEVILFDRLANPKLLDYAPADCEQIYCGKLPDRHTLRQDKINDLLVEKAAAGKRVVRLKGGDPGVFGRVGEEAEALALAEIEFEIIPGITSGIAAPLYAGIPVTHREFGETFAIVTAHNKSSDGKPVLNWQALANGIDTIAFYMGIANLPYICENLIQSGKAPETPVILIQWGTFSRQNTLEGTLSTIAGLAAEKNFSNPAITLVGNIVSLRRKINWFEKKPLFGRQILLARTGTQPGNLAKLLTEQGADVIEFPKWKSEKVAVDMKVLENLSGYEEILFTSAESVSVFFQILRETEIDIRTISANLFGLSKKTITALHERGLQAEMTAYREPRDELLVIGDSRIGEHQYELCHTFITNKNMIDTDHLPILQRMISEANPDTIIFPSAASVRIFFEEAQMSELYSYQNLKDINVVSMGAKTTDSLKFYGVKSDAAAQTPTGSALIEAILSCSRS
ncbi:uroporphyrinogen-III C-methyltransferase [Bacillus benzoevorans]|uniref:Uroporphyrinogen-III C-methyltransferase n=1 Tax=Bacillus benzoevorans TaxID=1456 RepID=A0A7X0LUE4_9BACI|nr:uroporphyrinogen-III C-methyltransferase [Bacillus benzoevorans]MBB6444340.1 uroporphyrinogen III methyltransferase/synthase [Bacillus benzoevorans]